MLKAILLEELMGGWLIFVSFLNLTSKQLSYNDVLIGIIVTVLGIAKYSLKNAKGLALTFIGFWMIIAAYIPTMLTPSVGSINNLAAGIFIAAVGFKTGEFTKKSGLL